MINMAWLYMKAGFNGLGIKSTGINHWRQYMMKQNGVELIFKLVDISVIEPLNRMGKNKKKVAHNFSKEELLVLSVTEIVNELIVADREKRDVDLNNDLIISVIWSSQRFDHLSDLVILAYPDMQLVDLGCNVGVFTLYAAGMGRHVVAVDVLPSNLKLLQASLTLNDHRNSAYATLLNAKYLYPVRQKIAKTGSTIHSETSRFSSVGINETRETDVSNKSLNRSKLNDVNILRAKKTDESYKEKFRIKRKQKIKFRQGKISRALQQFEESFNASSKNNSKMLHTNDKTMNNSEKLQNIVVKKNKSEMFNNGVNRTDLIKNYKEVVTNNSFSPNIDSHSENTTDVKRRNSTTEIHRISELVTLVHNAVYSDRSSRLAVHISPDGNIGGSEVVPINSDLLDDQPGDLILVDTVCLDDLLPLVKAPSVYLKMDIEGSEPHALKCAEKFFEKLHVRFVLMEWLFQLRTSGKSRSAAPDIIRFFTAKGYIPTTGAGLDVRGEAGENRGVYVLDVNFWYRWPELILWMER
ncbi:hypothetical protein Btru_062530 [Bulinus truncatus]|nr:hypothetical protein Btru_062530 [Bulinus truncatus]